MLALTRKRNESVEIVCPDGSIIQVIHVTCRGTTARYLISAPKNYKINRIEKRPEGISEAISLPTFEKSERKQTQDGKVILRRSPTKEEK